MTILTLYYTHKPGGFCGRLYRLLTALSESEEVIYLCLDEPPRGAIGAAKFHRIPFPLKARSGLPFWILFLLWAPVYAMRICGKRHFDQAVVLSPYYAALLTPARYFHKIPICLLSRSVSFRADKILKGDSALTKVMNLLDKIGLRMADKIIFMTEAMRRDFECWLQRPLPFSPVIPNNIAPSITLSAAEFKRTGTTVFAASRIDRGKNMELLLRAWKEVEASLPKAELRIAGDGPAANQARELKEKLRLKQVSFLGWCNTVEEEMEQADLFVHPSLLEGVSNAVISALSHSCPVLLSDIAEHRSLGADKSLLFSIESPQELSEKLLGYLKSDSRSQIEASSLSLAQSLQFDWEERMKCEILSI